jgi:hypothetical protein
LLGLRIIPGGYEGGIDNFNALSYISDVTYVRDKVWLWFI